MNTVSLYIIALLLAGAVASFCLPLLRHLLGPVFADAPGGLKKHTGAIPTVGGCAIMLGLCVSLIFIRYTTNFPTGTLHSLRGILCGAAMIFALGILDDLTKPRGVNIALKLAIQALAALCLVGYGVQITLEGCPQLSLVLTFLWVIGLTNAFNLLDIRDGLCISQATICALGLLLITLPGEQIYVNFCACALLGACLGFWPYNHAVRFKAFLGDSGSTLVGFLLAALAMGAEYSTHSPIGFLAPLLIFAVPIFDTAFVSIIRLIAGKNPLRGSPDHAALRLSKKGWSDKIILSVFMTTGLVFNLLAWAVTHLPLLSALTVYIFMLFLATGACIYLARIQAE